MGTPATICLQLNGRIQMIDVCQDGNYEQAGRKLVEYYKTLNAVKSLFALGGVISSVQKNLQDTISHSLHWDRDTEIQTCSVEHLQVFKDCMNEYTYIFNGDAFLANHGNGEPEFTDDDYGYWQALRHGERVSLEYIVEYL